MKRVPWSKEEDEYILELYAQGNSAFITYYKQSFFMNKIFHKGYLVRSEYSVRRREKKLLMQDCQPNSEQHSAPENRG